MHKSGTSLVAELLHHAGIAMVDEVDSQGGYDDGNTTLPSWPGSSGSWADRSSIAAIRGCGGAARPRRPATVRHGRGTGFGAARARKRSRRGWMPCGPR